MSEMGSGSVAICRDCVKCKLKESVSSQVNYENEKIYLLHLIKRTVKLGESNSAIVISSRSCGKICFVDCVLSELQEERDFQDSAVVVRLHGFVHTDDAVTLKAISSQMDLDRKSQGCMSGSFAENFSFLLDCLRTGDRTSSKSIIMILDEFDLFCRSKQTLLYNLFDVAQSANAPLCVLGLTCRMDVTELLEKRVKSRFSNRQIYSFPDDSESRLKDLKKIFFNMLSLPFNVKTSVYNSFACCWNENVEKLCTDPKFHEIIESFFQFDVSERYLHLFLNLIVSELDDHPNFLETKEFCGVNLLLSEDARVNVLESLSVLELCLIIGIKHHIGNFNNDPFNFEMVYGQYLKFITKNVLDFTTDRGVVMKAFNNIVNLELIVPVKCNQNGMFKEYQMFKLGISSQQVNIGIKNYKNLPTEVQQWAVNSVH